MCLSRIRAIAAALTLLASVAASLPALAQTNFATLATDGAWTWFNDPRALFHNGILYFGYNRAADGRVVLSTLNLQTGNVSNLWTSSLIQTDDHDLPGLLAKQDGTLLAIYSRHQNDQFFTCRLSTSTNPISPADWGPEQTNNTETTVGSGMTYANPFQLAAENGRVYNFARYLNYNPNVFTSTNGGASWSTPQILIQTGTGGTRPYVKYCSDNNQRLDFLYTDAHPDNTPTSLYHLRYLGGSFFKTDGTFVKSFANLPILHDSGERGSIVYQYSAAAQPDPNQWIPNARAWCWEIGYQTNGDPVCVFQVKVDNVTGANWFDARIYYYYARWTGAAWQKRFIAQAGRPLYNGQPDYGGGVCLDPSDPNTIYVSTDAANPFDLTTTTNVPLGANYQIWKGTTSDGGLTFSWQPITGNSTVDNLRPYIPRRFGGEPCVLWFRGTYASYTSFNCSIVGMFTTAVPTNTAPGNTPPKITYVDATSGPGGNTTLADGSVFSPPLNGTTGADNNWEQRTVFGSNGNIFESGGETAEDAPELRTTIGGLIPRANYSLFVFFWDATGTTENWSVRAGFNSAPDANPLYSAPDATGILSANAAVTASTLSYSNAPTIFVEANRVLLAAAIGNTAADSNGVIHVFVDDKPSTIGANNRTWYDGLGWALATASYPTNLSYAVTGTALSLSWPASHLGWRLESQINPANVGLSTNWSTVPGSTATNLMFLPIVATNATAFYRLAFP